MVTSLTLISLISPGTETVEPSAKVIFRGDGDGVMLPASAVIAASTSI